MTTRRVFHRIGSFLEEARGAVSTPSGDARGHYRPYPGIKARRDG
jgi:hypothetical protein